MRYVIYSTVIATMVFCGGIGHSYAGYVRQVPASKEAVIFSYAEIVKKVAPAVVNIYTRRKVTVNNVSPFFNDPFFRQFFGNGLGGGLQRERVESSLGSGVIVGKSGLIVTSNHVIAGSSEITVVLEDRREFDARILLKEEQTDLALLQIDTKAEVLPYLEIADSDDVAVGDIVLAVGNPFGVGQTVTHGIVSALARTTVGITDYQYFIQTDAAVNPGNSGGALVDLQGGLVGVNTAIYSQSGGSNGVGFAIPSNMVRSFLGGQKGGKVVRPWLGATLQSVDHEIAMSIGLKRPIGAIISQIYPGGPAERAGLKEGDVIVAVGGKEVLDEHALRFRVATYEVGALVVLDVIRDGTPLTVKMGMEIPPETPKRDERTLRGDHPFAGAVVINLSPAVADEMKVDLYKTGVIIKDVRSGIAANIGFQVQDIIVEINGKKITSTKQLETLLSSPRPDWRAAIERDGRLVQMVLGR